MSSESLNSLIEESSEVVLKFQHSTGAYPASPNFKPYLYSWFRDGSFIADGMSRAGQVESAERFFEWGNKIIIARQDQILSGEELDARYTFKGEESKEEWANFQIDGFGIWLWAVKEHATRHGREVEPYQEAVGLVQHYLTTHWQKPCFDWWEERKGIYAASLACIYAGLNAFEHPEAAGVKEAIDLSSERTDASLLACALFDAVDESTFSGVLERIETELVSSNGGVHRYLEDEYFGGGEWPVVSCMLGLYYIKLGRINDAKAKFDWTRSQIGENGWIPEQSQAHLLHPEKYQYWVEKWGNPANPLLWSHGMLLSLATELQSALSHE